MTRPSTDPAEGAPSLVRLQTHLRQLDRVYPRLLGQIDRDPDSPTFGSCDRSFWLYRLHDFDSGVLQQASLTLALLHELAETADLSGLCHLHADHRPHWRQLALAINRRTARLLQRGHGLLDEYYPGERSYPGTVFSAYATLKSALMLGQAEIVEHPGLQATAEVLSSRAPGPAANQDAAAAAFFGLYAQATGQFADQAGPRIETWLAGPDGRGQMSEYGGTDLGYASVSLHFLACLAMDQTHDVDQKIASLGELLADFVTPAGRLGGEFASRSTSYFLPFGLLVACARSPALGAHLQRLDVHTNLAKLDDRYLMHYCLPSLARAASWLSRHTLPAHGGEPSSTSPPIESRARDLLRWRRAGTMVVVGLHKGGVIHLEVDGRTTLDCGYRIYDGQQGYGSSELDPDPQATVDHRGWGLEITVRARFRRYRSLMASPGKTLALRLLAPLGAAMGQYFRNRLIQSTEVLPGAALIRRIRLDERTSELVIEDVIEGLRPGHRLRRAPPSSFRLVPSARLFQPGDAEAFMEAQPVEPRSVRRFSLGEHP